MLDGLQAADFFLSGMEPAHDLYKTKQDTSSLADSESTRGNEPQTI